MTVPDQVAVQAVECAAALVTECLEEAPNRSVINQLITEAREGGWLYDLTAALALGFASNVEAIGKLVKEDPKVLWQRWCLREQAQLDRYRGRPFDK